MEKKILYAIITALFIILLGISFSDYTDNPQFARKNQYTFDKINDTVVHQTLPHGKPNEICKISDIRDVAVGSEGASNNGYRSSGSGRQQIVLLTKDSQIIVYTNYRSLYDADLFGDRLRDFIRSNVQESRTYTFNNDRMVEIITLIISIPLFVAFGIRQLKRRREEESDFFNI